MSTSPFRARRLRRRSGWAWLLIATFVVVPILEIYVIIQVGQVIGAWWTLLLLVADSVFGGWLIKHEGRRAWRALTATIESGGLPSKELADGALILVGGTLMVSPGFVTDVVGIFLILPFTRPVARRLLSSYFSRRLLVARSSGPGPSGPVVRGEVVDE